MHSSCSPYSSWRLRLCFLPIRRTSIMPMKQPQRCSRQTPPSKQRRKFTILTPDAANDSGAGLIFYPGGKVQETAYLPLLEQLRQNGLTCVLVRMPFRLAVFNIDAANGVYAQFPAISRWYLAGHSLGGAMASSYVEKNSDRLAGLILLGAYPRQRRRLANACRLRQRGRQTRPNEAGNRCRQARNYRRESRLFWQLWRAGRRRNGEHLAGRTSRRRQLPPSSRLFKKRRKRARPPGLPLGKQQASRPRGIIHGNRKGSNMEQDREKENSGEERLPLNKENIRLLWSRTYNTNGKPDWSHIYTYYHEDIMFQDTIQRIEGKEEFVLLCKRLTDRCKELKMELGTIFVKE